jgi:glycosyltransferase EpsE
MPKNEETLVSIVMPIYNCDKYLRTSIDSILSQTFKYFEFIIINDGSNDTSASIVESYDDPRIRFINERFNIKLPKRRNQAINLARGRYIVIHDGDDISDRTRIETQVRFMENNIAYFFIGGWATKIDSDGNVTGDMDYPPPTHDDCIEMITKKCMNPFIDPTAMFRRRDFLELGGYSQEPSIYTIPDFDLWLRAIESGKKFANLQEPLTQYRENPDGMTLKHKDEMIRAHMIAWRRFMSNYINKDINNRRFYVKRNTQN